MTDDPAVAGALVALRERQALLDRLLVAEGAGHIVHDLPVRADGRAVSLESRPWRLDPIPFVIPAAEFTWLERAVTERMETAEAVLDDLYGPRRLVADRVIEPAALWATSRYRLSAMGDRPTRWLTTYSVDVVRDLAGGWHAIQESTDAPSGLGYALLSRAITDRADGHRAAAPILPDESTGDRPRPLRSSLATLRRGLAETTSVPGARIAILTGGIDHASYVEHSYLATRLGFNLVEGADLVVRQRRLWLRTLAGLAPIDVVHRRLDDDELDPLEVGTEGTAGVPSILLPVTAGTLSISNAYGSGLLEAAELRAALPRAARALTGHDPTLPTATRPTRPGAGVDDWLPTAAERVPCLVEGRLDESPLVVRMMAIATDDGVTVVPGGAGRVLAAGDDPRRPTPCVAKDVWVLGPSAAVVVDVPRAPQVDLIASVPTRAADSLYWLGRAAERAEALARLMRVVVPASHESDENDEMMLVLLGASSADVPAVDPSSAASLAPGPGLDAALDVSSVELARDVGVVMAEASSVREFLSTTAGRVLGRMVDARAVLQHGAPGTDTIDELLLQLSAFAGLWSESVLHGPAWHFGEFGRRYERAVTTLATVAGALDAAVDPRFDTATQARALECALAANDSLVAYRRRHRSDVTVPDVVALLVADERNPRSVAASLDAMRDAAAAMGWEEGGEALAAMSDDLLGSIRSGEVGGPPPTAALRALSSMLGDLAVSLTATRLVVPPDPTTMGGFT